MPDRSSTLSTWDGVSDHDLSALVQKGKGSGRLDLGEVLEVFKDVDLTAPTIVAIRGLLAAEGIELDEESGDRAELTVVDSAETKPVAPDTAPDGDDDLLDEVALKRAERSARLAAGPFNPSGAGGTADPVRMYLKEIGRVPLLTAADEVRLAKRIQRGLGAEERVADLAAGEDCDRVDPTELAMLRRRIRDGERAKGELTQANLRLVVSIAKRYVGRGMLLLDLVQEGNLGLMRAVEKFDHTKGFKFSTYATWWIRQAITRSIADQSRTIRIPVHMVESINRVKRVQRQMMQELEREPSIEELAERTDLSPERIREILRISLDPLSLDSPMGEEDDANLGDFIEDERVERPAEVAARNMLGEAILEALDDLTEREKEVVRLRFGLMPDGRPRTLEEVGRHFGVTRERIRQIESKTLAKLRHPLRSEKLRDYLDGA